MDFYGRTFNTLDDVKQENIKAAPVIYQELLPKNKSVEYRINVFGDKISSLKYSNVQSDDWHFEDIRGIKMLEYKLPIDLKIGTVDLIFYQNTWYFLEINLAGDWRWLEHAASTDFSKDVLSILNN
ncbi:ATP-grasp domain-containing protein [Brochothrix campestris]|uniref:Uncharacterized protein n=1 Tax=Brochothrix campestris FSL F6-1037 TaxID=1265861 RepID=W7CR10_9LIST|nr:hypothetical protein [Brochothrix campestris]EUJ35398.1 hypothetical protein BCAMP_11980 [Brochothrix campestris FSL F6-1037]